MSKSELVLYSTVALWDLRNMRKEGKLCRAVDVVSQKRLVESAYFSPVTGQYILSTSMDDTVQYVLWLYSVRVLALIRLG